jgi:hypothetical protein
LPNDSAILPRAAADDRDAARDSAQVHMREASDCSCPPMVVINLAGALAAGLGILGGIVVFVVAAACLVF